MVFRTVSAEIFATEKLLHAACRDAGHPRADIGRSVRIEGDIAGFDS